MIQAIATVLDFAPAEWSPGKRLVAIAIADRVNPETNECFPSLADISKRTGLSERQVRRYVRELEAEKVIMLKERRFNNSNVWIWLLTATPQLWKTPENVVEFLKRDRTPMSGGADTHDRSRPDTHVRLNVNKTQ